VREVRCRWVCSSVFSLSGSAAAPPQNVYMRDLPTGSTLYFTIFILLDIFYFSY